MASTAQNFARAFAHAAPARASLRTTARFTLPNQAFRTASKRTYSSAAGGAPKKGCNLAAWAIGAGALGAGGYYYYAKSGDGKYVNVKVFKPGKDDYQKVYDEIAKMLVDNDDYDDGSYGPVLTRLAWHASGTYDAKTNTGGSSGATIRFAPESDHGGNAGLEHARKFLEPVKEKFPWISYADLYTLGGVAGVQELGGPDIAWRPGRPDWDATACTPDGRLPDGDKDNKHVHDVFSRMGFNVQETVALIGAHTLGRCHPDRSGFDGPWDFSPINFSNDFFQLLVDEKWQFRKWDGPQQYTDKSTQTLMMLPTDMALIKDKDFKKYVEIYAKDNDRFFKDFSAAFSKLLELGVNFKEGQEPFILKRSE